jgi:hypothetical protein
MQRGYFIMAAVLFFPALTWGAPACKEPPSRPDLPAVNANGRELERAGKEIDRYVKALTQYRDCHLKIVNDANNELTALVEGWNEAVTRYKEAAKEK